jgi:Uncharacterised protein conserved in bacteria (DUF2336)
MPPTTRNPSVDGPAGDPADVVEQVAQGYLLLDDTVIAFADADHIPGLALLLARRTGVSTAVVECALAAKSPELATVLCRAAGFGTNGFSAVLRMRRRSLPAEEMSPAAALSGFLAMPVDVARLTVAIIKGNGER